jgi:hypothetical protein
MKKRCARHLDDLARFEKPPALARFFAVNDDRGRIAPAETSSGCGSPAAMCELA